MRKTLKAGRVDVDVEQLRSYTEEKAIEVMVPAHKIPKSEVIRVWKIANAKSEPKKQNLDSDK